MLRIGNLTPFRQIYSGVVIEGRQVVQVVGLMIRAPIIKNPLLCWWWRRNRLSSEGLKWDGSGQRLRLLKTSIANFGLMVMFRANLANEVWIFVSRRMWALVRGKRRSDRSRAKDWFIYGPSGGRGEYRLRGIVKRLSLRRLRVTDVVACVKSNLRIIRGSGVKYRGRRHGWKRVRRS